MKWIWVNLVVFSYGVRVFEWRNAYSHCMVGKYSLIFNLTLIKLTHSLSLSLSVDIMLLYVVRSEFVLACVRRHIHSVWFVLVEWREKSATGKIAIALFRNWGKRPNVRQSMTRLRWRSHFGWLAESALAQTHSSSRPNIYNVWEFFLYFTLASRVDCSVTVCA